MNWNEGNARPVPLAELGQQYRRYRLADPEAEEAMAGSLRRWGQLSPVVACVRDEALELIDGFKRWSAAGRIPGMTLSVRVLNVDEPTAKAAILGLNRDQRPARELEEAWVVQGLVRDDGMTQVEAAHRTRLPSRAQQKSRGSRYQKRKIVVFLQEIAYTFRAGRGYQTTYYRGGLSCLPAVGMAVGNAWRGTHL